MISYIEILKIIKSKSVDLRHDIDISLLSAYNIANLEKNMGFKSIYYIRFDSDYYNVISQESEKIINFLIQNHEVGCHVDVSNIENEDQLLEYLIRFSKIVPFEKFTFHINTNKTKLFGDVTGFINKSILKGDYISDSRNLFTIEDLNKVKDLSSYTLLTHPEWWDNSVYIFDGKSTDKLIESMRLEELTKKALKEILDINE